MSEVKDTQIPSVRISDIENLMERVKRDMAIEDIEISFEFIIASLFPSSWKNIQNALSAQYREGYIKGYKDGERDARHFFRSDDDADCYCE